KEQTGDEYGLLVEKSALDEKEYAGTLAGKRNNWNDRPDTVVIDSTTPDQSIMELSGGFASIPEDGRLLQEISRGKATYVRGVLPVKDAAGRRAGALFVVHDITPIHESMAVTRREMIAALAFFTVLLTALLLVLLQRVVVRRLVRMRTAMEDVGARLAGGDYDVKAPPAMAKDELGEFETFFGGFISVVSGLLRALTRPPAP
ncbi:MAG TPA: HAMP domain-containing protein, partial [Anaeromyxobacteraceae bacterium]|nr:HAMP domain-containing protein [Anaeromyxobacteraceae bacterium]